VIAELPPRWLVAAALCLAPAAARAGNRESNPLGSEAALSGGAVTALGRDTGSIYYNPAGIAAMQRTQVNLSTQALQFRLRVVPNAVIAELPGGSTDRATLSSIQLLAMPSSLAVTRHIGRGVTLGAGYFAPEYDYYDYGASLRGKADGTEYEARVQADGWIMRYHIGPSIGYQPHPRFRIGASFFVTYGWRREEGRLWAQTASGAHSSPTTADLSSDVDDKRSLYGGEVVLGLQWEFLRNLHLGLSFRTPRFVAYQHHKTFALTTGHTDSPGQPGTHVFSFDETPDPLIRGRVAPMRLTIGLGYAFAGGRGWVSGEVDFSPRLELPERGVFTRAIWNVRAGVRVRLTDRMVYGFGVFTDRDDETRTRNFPHFRINYYGATTGGEFRSPVRLGKGERARTIVFTTTLALRYAYGHGTAAQVVLDLADAPRGQILPVVRSLHPIEFHLIAGHLGMGTYF